MTGSQTTGMRGAAAPPAEGMAARLRRVGAVAWSLLGVIVLAVVVASAIGALSGILIPLAVAVILGIVLEPVADLLRRRGVPSTPAVVITLLAAVAVAAATIAVVVVGFVGQWGQITDQLWAGWQSFLNRVRELDIDPDRLDRIRAATGDYAADLGQGVLGLVAGTVYGAVSLAMGVFFALFFLFFVLRDGDRFLTWVGRRRSVPADELAAVVALFRQSFRGYFRGTAITALATAPIFMVPLLLLGVPLALPIFVLYFFLSFIPFLGAWITGAFAVLIALGSGGSTAALIVGVTFVISNGTVQSMVGSWALGSSLKIHPTAVLLSTMVGGTVAGLLGMVLGAPVTAAAARSWTAVREIRSARAGKSSGPTSTEPEPGPEPETEPEPESEPGPEPDPGPDTAQDPPEPAAPAPPPGPASADPGD